MSHVDDIYGVGCAHSRNRVNRLCSAYRLWSAQARERGTGRRLGPPVRDDLVERQFSAAQPDQSWLNDISEHPAAEGKLCLRAVLDACNKQIAEHGLIRSARAVPVLLLVPHRVQRPQRPRLLVRQLEPGEL